MISFRNSSDSAVSVAIILAILVLAGTLGVIVVNQPPKQKYTINQMTQQKLQIDEIRKKAEQQKKAAVAEADNWLWTGAPEDVVHGVLSRATNLTQLHKLKFISLKPPQKADVNNGLAQFPFQITVSGPFPEVAAMVKDLETPSERLCVNLVQMNAAEGGSDNVTAIIGAIAFQRPPAPVRTTTTTKTTTTPAPAAIPTS